MKNALYKPIGFLFLILGVIGIFLPVVPTTPFVLLAAWCFARSSRKWHNWLLDSELFGPMLRDWEARRCIACRTKVVALGAMLVAGGASVVLVLESNGLRLLAVSLMAVGCITVLSIKTCPGQDNDAGQH